MSLTAPEILYLHDVALEYGGGAPGIRDVGLVSAAIGRALQTFDGRPLYATPLLEAAACAHAIAHDHPFMDGNKPTGFLVLGLWLKRNGIPWSAAPDDAEHAFLAVAVGQWQAGDMVAWAAERVLHPEGT